MKTNIRSLSISLLAITSILASCKKDEFGKPIGPYSGIEASAVKAKPAGQNPSPNSEVEASAVRPKPVQQKFDLTNTTWVITRFDDEGMEDAYLYKENSFAFYKDNLVVAMKAGVPMEKGKWSSVMGDKSSLTLSFEKVDPYSKLAGNWRVTKTSDNMLFLERETYSGFTIKVTMEKLMKM